MFSSSPALVPSSRRRPSLAVEVCEQRIVPAARLPTGFEQSLLADGFQSTIDMEILPDGRVLIAEQEGIVRVWKNGQLLAEPFLKLDVASYTFSFEEEEGLMGVVADPDFASNRYIYIYHTVPDAAGNFNRVSRFTVVGDKVDPASRVTIFDTDPLVAFFAYHIGGAMKFGPDGKLYIAIGESGFNAKVQDMNSLYGKILRINKDGSIPTDNPFVDSVAGKSQAIYALGFRNPFKMSFHPVTGALYVNDVGADSWEEINEIQPGKNYGWPLYEGPSDDANYETPLYAYPHGEGDFEGYAVIGSAWYRTGTGPSFPTSYQGDYFFTDIRRNWMHVWDVETQKARQFGENFSFVIDLEVAPDGKLFVLERGEGFFSAGRLSSITFTGTNKPYIVAPPRDQLTSAGETVTFTFESGGTGQLSYQWLKNGVAIPNATQASLTLDEPALADDGAKISVRVTNANGSVTSSSAILEVTANRPPSVTLLTPNIETRFTGGGTLSFAATARDPEIGTLTGAAFVWEAYLVTGGVPRPLLNPTTGITAGEIAIPTDMAFARTDITILLRLTVTDNIGLKTTIEQSVLPQLSTVVVTSNLPDPSVDALLVEGNPKETPYDWQGAVGIRRYIDAKSEVMIDGEKWVFASWSNGFGRIQRIAPEVDPTTLTAFYRKETSVVPPSNSDGPTIIEVTLSPTTANGTQLVAPTTRIVDGVLFVFQRWTDGVIDATRTLPPGEASMVARYIPAAPLVVAPNAGQPPIVSLFDPLTGAMRAEFEAYETTFTGGVRVATGDVDGDGVIDVVVGPGTGGGSFVKVFDGRGGTLSKSFLVFEERFRGGVFVAVGDLNRDGVADILVAAGDGGGPRIRIFDGITGEGIADFFAIDDPNFRGGTRLAVGDVNGDGFLDLIAVAGPGGGPRVAIYDGKSLLSEEPVKLVADFFVFESRLRDGVYVTAGDIRGQGIADLAFGAGPGGGPRVFVVDSEAMLASQGEELKPLANFFAGDVSDRGGVALAFTQFDGDGRADLLTGSGSQPDTRVYSAVSLLTSEEVAWFSTLATLDESITKGVFVG